MGEALWQLVKAMVQEVEAGEGTCGNLVESSRVDTLVGYYFCLS